MIFFQILFLLLTYLTSAIPFGLVLVKIFVKKDVRNFGSKNIGATNVTRVAGKKLGLATLILDGAKGALMVILAKIFFEDQQNFYPYISLVAFTAVIGHIFPIYLKFKGGKGVATTLATLIALNPLIGILTSLIWLISFLFFRISAISSITSIFCSILLSFLYGSPPSQNILCITLFILIFIRHKDNISRLRQGKENKI